MATEGLRRSARVRKPVKTYASEQAEDNEPTLKAPPKQKRKKTIEDDASDDEAIKPMKKAAKKTKSSKADANVADEGSSKKPKASSSKPKRATTNSSWHADAAERRIAVTTRKTTQLRPGEAEYRLRSYVTEPAQAYHNALKKANKERMFVLNRERGVEDDCHANHHDCPCEKVQMAGSTGNVYTVTISHVPSCTCPAGIFNRKGDEKLCKHTVYVLHNVLKASGLLKQQNAFLTSELKEIFSNAPALPSQVAEDEPMDGKRKKVEDDCPICCMEFEAEEEVVWCRAACGNNIHKGCFNQWAATKAGNVTCPFCRTPWEHDAPRTQKLNVAKVDIPDARGASGYRNVRDQLDYDD